MPRFRYHQFCPIAKAAEVLGERWTILIVRELLVGATRFSDLQRGLSQISPTLLTKRLSQLQDCGVVVQRKLPGQQRKDYCLTPAGRELLPVVMSLARWGMKWARGQMSDDELDVQLLMVEFCRRLDESQLPNGRTVVQFVFNNLPKLGHWWIVLNQGKPRELCVSNPRLPVDLQLRSDVRTMAEIWSGDTELRTAVKDGRLKLLGDPALMRNVSAWLRIGLFAGVKRQVKRTPLAG